MKALLIALLISLSFSVNAQVIISDNDKYPDITLEAICTDPGTTYYGCCNTPEWPNELWVQSPIFISNLDDASNNCFSAHAQIEKTCSKEDTKIYHHDPNVRLSPNCTVHIINK